MYQHYVQYYETDKMGVTHHSNYIRFMEEARVQFFKGIGLDYFEFEKKGFISPVVGLNNIRYKRPSTAGDTLDIDVAIKEIGTVTFTIQYIMKNKNVVVFTGESEHCLLGKDGKIVPLTDKRVASLTEKLKQFIIQQAPIFRQQMMSLKNRRLYRLFIIF